MRAKKLLGISQGPTRGLRLANLDKRDIVDAKQFTMTRTPAFDSGATGKGA
jgi:hypothetical protein